MKTTIELFVFGILSLVLTLVFIPIIKIIALKVNLVDKPNYRKIHNSPIPLVGGISIALTVLLVLLISENKLSFLMEYLPIISSAFVLLITGVIDDKIDLSAKYKLVIQLLLAFIVALADIRITSLYGLFGIYEIAVWSQYLLTIIIITGVVNAFNLMDGVDGLVGGLSVLGFAMFLLASVYFNDYTLGKICAIFIGAVIGFLRFNLSKNKIFMGDSGSLFLGFILVTLGIQLMEKQSNISTTNYGYSFLFSCCFICHPSIRFLKGIYGKNQKWEFSF